jgi:hypothetical protein
MNQLLITLGVGLLVASADTAPMWLRGNDHYLAATAFIHWMVVVFLISYTSLALPGWAKGMLIASLASTPLIMGLWKTAPQAVLHISVITLVLGAVSGVALQWAMRWVSKA